MIKEIIRVDIIERERPRRINERSLDGRELEVLEEGGVVLLFPLGVGLVDACLHLLERALEHGSKHLTHVVDLLIQLRYLLLLFLLYVLLLLVYLRELLFQLVDLVIVPQNLLVKQYLLVAEFLVARLVLPGHVCDYVSLTVALFFEQSV
jgi:hypothetical protein